MTTKQEGMNRKSIWKRTTYQRQRLPIPGGCMEVSQETAWAHWQNHLLSRQVVVSWGTGSTGLRGANVWLSLKWSVWKQTNKQKTPLMGGGGGFPGQTTSVMGWHGKDGMGWNGMGVFPPQVSACILSTAWISAPLWLHGSFSSIFILTGQFYDIFSSTGFASQRRRVQVKLPALSFHKATSQHLPGLQRSLTNPAAYSPSFYSEQMVSWALGVAHAPLGVVERIPIVQGGPSLCTWVRRHWVFAPSSHSSLEDKVTLSSHKFYLESALEN